jgi:hypothetical protein
MFRVRVKPIANSLLTQSEGIKHKGCVKSHWANVLLLFYSHPLVLDLHGFKHYYNDFHIIFRALSLMIFCPRIKRRISVIREKELKVTFTKSYHYVLAIFRVKSFSFQDTQFIRYTHLAPCRTPLCLQNSSSGHGNVAQLISRDLMCATSLYHWHQAERGNGLMLLTPNPNSAISMTQQEPGFVGPGDVFPFLSCPVLVIARPLEPLLPVFSW